MQNLNVFYDVIMNISILIASTYFFSFAFDLRFHGYKKIVLLLICFILIIKLQSLSYNLYFLTNISTHLLLYFFCCSLMFHGKQILKLLYFSIFCIYTCLLTLSIDIILSFLNVFTTEASIIKIIIVNLLIYISIRLFVKQLSELLQGLPNKTTSILVYMIIVTVVIFFSNNFIMNDNINIYFRISNLIFIYIVFFGFLYALHDISKQYKYLSDLQRISTTKNLMSDYMEKQIQTLSSMKKIKHDLDGTLQLLNNLLDKNETQKAKEYLQSKVNSIHTISNVNEYTGNIYIDIILNDFIIKHDCIKFEISSLGLQLYVIESDEIIVLLLNLLKNAIEATEKLEESEKIIKMKIRGNKDTLYLEISNSYDGIINRNFLTRKSDKTYHGLGLKIINDIVKKQNGILDIDTNNNIFKVKIILNHDIEY